MGAACSIHVDDKCVQGSVSKSERRDHLGEPDVDGKIILKWILKKNRNESFHWVRLA
jgi:hypothetical protein